MEVDTSMMIILVCHGTLLRQHRYGYLDSVIKSSWMYMHDKKTRPTVTNTYHHGSVFFCSDYAQRKHQITFILGSTLIPKVKGMCDGDLINTTRQNPSSSVGLMPSSSAGSRTTNKALQLLLSSSACDTRYC